VFTLIFIYIFEGRGFELQSGYSNYFAENLYAKPVEHNVVVQLQVIADRYHSVVLLQILWYLYISEYDLLIYVNKL